MAKRITDEAISFIKSNGALYAEIASLLEVELPAIGVYLWRNKKIFSRHDVVEAIAKSMDKKPAEVFKETDEKQAATA